MDNLQHIWGLVHGARSQGVSLVWRETTAVHFPSQGGYWNDDIKPLQSNQSVRCVDSSANPQASLQVGCPSLLVPSLAFSRLLASSHCLSPSLAFYHFFSGRVGPEHERRRHPHRPGARPAHPARLSGASNLPCVSPLSAHAISRLSHTSLRVLQATHSAPARCHVGAGGDCLHWLMPGVTSYLSDVLIEHLASGLGTPC